MSEEKDRGFLATMKRGWEHFKKDPGVALRDAKGQLTEAEQAMKNAAEGAVDVATMGKGAEPATNLRDVLQEAWDKSRARQERNDNL